MVALAVGALLGLLALAMLGMANTGYVLQTQAAQLDDNGRYALDMVGRALRQTGWQNWDGTTGPIELDAAAPAALDGLDAHSLGRAGEGIEVAAADVANGSDVLAVRFDGAGAAPDGDGSVVNCAGFGVPAEQGPPSRGWSIFYVGRGADGETELRCKYRGHAGWAADALVRGVDSFQVLYGLDSTDGAPGPSHGFVTASTLRALDAALVLAAPDAAGQARERQRRTYWKRVRSVRIALLLHSERGGGGEGEPALFDLFGKAYSDAFAGSDPGTRIDEARLPPDLRARARRVVSASFTLRNRAL